MKLNLTNIWETIRKYGKRNMMAAVSSSLFFVALIITYCVIMYYFAHESIISKGETNAVRSAEQFDSYLITEKLIIEQAGFILNKMIDEGQNSEEIRNYMVDDTNFIKSYVNDKITGLYGYINGEYFDGALWEPDDPTWVATERPWYKKAIANNGQITLIEPYVDAQTGEITMTVAQTLKDNVSVVAIDISFDMIQMIIEDKPENESKTIQIVLDDHGNVLAHTDTDEIGHNYIEESGTLGAAMVEKLYGTDEQCFELNYNGQNYVVYVIMLNDSWYSVALIDSQSGYRPLIIMIILTGVIIIITIIILMLIFRNLNRKNLIAERLNHQLSTMSDIYRLLIDVDLENNTLEEIRRNENTAALLNMSQGNAQETLHALVDILVDEGYHALLHEFVDFGTINERLAQTNTVTIEFMMYDGEWRRGRFVVSERDSDGRLTHVLWLVEDIDEEKRKRDELVDMSTRAIAASEAKSTFLSNMSHEIRTPINAILGMNEMILRECEDSNVIAYSDSIQTAGNTLLGIVNDVLDFSKIEAGKMEIIPVDYDLASMLNDLVNMIQTRIDAKGLLLELDFDRHIPGLLHGDEIRIKQVITNILTNAVKYTEKGTISFSVGYDIIASEPESIMLNVSVRDTGIGIRKEDMDKLFTEFDRIDETRNRNVEGTGLGMAITQSLLNMMGSTLSVKSRYGHGSTFGFSIKQKVVSFDVLGDYEKAYRRSLEKREVYKERFTAEDARILIVDDTQMNIMVFKSLLKKTLINIDMALSGDEGIEATLKNKYDIIFLDHMMPEKDGIETLNELKANTDNPNVNTPVICLTANAVSGAREQYLAAGFDDYLTKPIDSKRLEEMIIKYLEKGKVSITEDQKSDLNSINEHPQFASLEGIDADRGIANCGSVEDYDNILRIFHDSYSNKRAELTDLYEAQDWQNYTVKVHALKSSAFIIGATELGELALRLEHAGKADDIGRILNEHETLLEIFDGVYTKLDKLYSDKVKDENGDARPEVDLDFLNEALSTIEMAAEQMDTDVLDTMLGKLRKYSLPPNIQEKIDSITEMFNNFEYEKIKEILEGENRND